MRNYQIDLLRFIGLFMIILAHCSPHPFLFQFRNFDVPLMVLISGISFKLSYKDNDTYIKYVWKRVKRLVFPVWIFLTLFFCLVYLVFPNKISTHQILTSFLLLSGIGYVWIIRVFLLVAIVAPLLFKIDKKVTSDFLFFSLLVLSFLFYEILQNNSYPYFQTNIYLRFISSILFFIIPYSLVYLLGIRVYNLSKKKIIRISLICLTLFITLATIFYFKENKFVQTQEYKYPLSTYYLSYALTISFFLWLISNYTWGKLNDKTKQFILFISSNSIWIYLWHIPFIKVINITNYNYIIEYIFVLFFAILITFFQAYLLDFIVLPNISNLKMKKNLKILFKG